MLKIVNSNIKDLKNLFFILNTKIITFNKGVLATDFLYSHSIRLYHIIATILFFGKLIIFDFFD